MISVDVKGIPEVHKMLGKAMDPELTKRLQSATKAGGSVFKAPLQVEAGRVSKRMARAVSVRQAKREKPATIVSFRRKTAPFAAWVIGGTHDHGPRKASALVFEGRGGIVVTKRVRGVRANPMVARVFAMDRSQSMDAVLRDFKSTEK